VQPRAAALTEPGQRVELVGASLGLGDGDVNLGTVLQAERRLDAEKTPAPC